MDKPLGCVYLVGAGCESADLITLRGLRLLQSCQAVVYDDLIPQELLLQVPAEAERIYVGKRLGRHSKRQEEICSILIRQAQMGRQVVRLKGGDPFVFGRGGEELLALQAAGIPWAEVPGVSSAIAIPALAGIPVTHRGLSRGVHIVTAHTQNTEDGLPDHLDDLAKLPDTLVFLMGLHQLEKLAARLTAAGKAPDTPAAVISGKRISQAVRGNLENIARLTKAAGLEAPAVIVVGPVAALDLSSALDRPLEGVRVGITGSPAIAEKLGRRLRALGARISAVEPYVIEELPAPFRWPLLWEREGGWAVFTSGNGVRIFFRRMLQEGVDLRNLRGCRFAVIGPGTGAALAAYGIRADLCPGVHTSEGLAEALLRETRPGDAVFLFRSAQGSPVLPRRLSGSRAVREVPLYQMRPLPLSGEAPRPEPPDYLTFASAGGVRFFFEKYRQIPPGVMPVCIGPVTARALKEHGQTEFLTAEDISAEGILREILKHRAASARKDPITAST